MLDIEYIKTHILEECLKEFRGEDGVEDNLTQQFELLDRKLLWGGHFEVSCNGHLIRSVYLHTIEFYYHEEYGPVKDYIVYHRNPEKKNIIFPPFRIGSLNAHQSGIDITFEDWRNADNPKYRASALIRAVKVKDAYEESFNEVDVRAKYVYEYLFMGAPVSDIRVQWIHDDLSDSIPEPIERLRVPLFD